MTGFGAFSVSPNTTCEFRADYSIFGHKMSLSLVEFALALGLIGLSLVVVGLVVATLKMKTRIGILEENCLQNEEIRFVKDSISALKDGHLDGSIDSHMDSETREADETLDDAMELTEDEEPNQAHHDQPMTTPRQKKQDSGVGVRHSVRQKKQNRAKRRRPPN